MVCRHGTTCHFKSVFKYIYDSNFLVFLSTCLFQYDCLHRTPLKATWYLFLSLDEIVYSAEAMRKQFPRRRRFQTGKKKNMSQNYKFVINNFGSKFI